MSTISSSVYILLFYFSWFCCHCSNADSCSISNICDSNSTCVADASLQQGYHCSCNQHGHLSSSAFVGLYQRNIVLPWKHQYCRKNLALKGVASQSSTNMEHPSSAKNAIDITRTSGDVRSHGCSLTTIMNDPWLMIDLKHLSTIRQVAVKRADCCPAEVQVLVGNSNVHGGISNDHCGHLTILQQNSYTSIVCSPKRVGRYVSVAYPGEKKELAICGLEIYSDFTDYDECRASDACADQDRMSCTNTVGSFICECKKGTLYNHEKQICIDDDECRLGTHNCSNNAQCHNTVDSYECVCNDGFYGDGYTCNDVNECKTNEVDCGSDVKVHCINTMGSYNCSCVTGFKFDSHEKECIDFDECKNTEVLCRPGSCINAHGSYKCDACREGFSRQGWMCIDFDECKYGKYVCPDNEVCKNTVGSYICICKPGYQRSGDDCRDIDECSTGDVTCPKHSKCVNVKGSYRCICKHGYTEEKNDENEQVCRSAIKEIESTISCSTLLLVQCSLMVIMLMSNGVTWSYL